MMGAKGKLLGFLMTAVVMAVAWTIMDMDLLRGFEDNFFGKLLICLAILIISKILGFVLGAD